MVCDSIKSNAVYIVVESSSTTHKKALSDQIVLFLHIGIYGSRHIILINTTDTIERAVEFTYLNWTA